MIYSTYRPTEYDWLGSIPSAWRWVYLSQSCNEQSIKNIGNAVSNVLSLSYGQIIKKKNIDFGLSPKDYGTYQIVDSGNIIMRLTDLQNDHKSLRTGLVKERGIITSAYVCLKPFENSAFLQYLLHSYDTQKYFYGLGGGVRQSIGYKDIKYMKVPFPPREEQDQIVRYLDWKVSQINKLISAKRRQIEVLQEQKRALVNSRLKGNKVWLKRLLSTPFQYGANDSGVEYSATLPRYIRITDITNDGKLKTDGAKSLSNDVAKQYILTDGDILLARSGATAGKSFLYKEEYGLCAFAGYLIKARVIMQMIIPEYLIYVMNSSEYEQWKNSVFIQATIQNISAERYSQLPVPVPTLPEQEEIVLYLNEQCEYIDKVSSKLNEEITLLHEYRTRLISDVVTGKLDVRDVVVPEYEAVEDIVNNEPDIDDYNV